MRFNNPITAAVRVFVTSLRRPIVRRVSREIDRRLVEANCAGGPQPSRGLRVALLSLAIVAPCYAWAQSDPAGLAEVRSRLDAGMPQEVFVTFDDKDIQSEALSLELSNKRGQVLYSVGLRGRLRLEESPPPVLDGQNELSH